MFVATLLCVELLTGQLLGAAADKPAAAIAYAFRPMGEAKNDDLLKSKTNPDGTVRLELAGQKARLVDVASGRQIGKELNAGTMWTERHPFAFTCWSFSPDGKAVATGNRFYEVSGSRGKEVTHVGRIHVWDAKTGELILQHTPRIGGVHAIAFSKDGKTIFYEAARHEIDGP
jgi:WD40 repeat protein